MCGSEYLLDYGLNNHGIGVRFPAVSEIFLFVSKLTLGPTHCPVEGYVGFIPGFSARGEANCLSPYGAEDKSAWIYTSVLPYGFRCAT